MAALSSLTFVILEETSETLVNKSFKFLQNLILLGFKHRFWIWVIGERIKGKFGQFLRYFKV